MAVEITNDIMTRIADIAKTATGIATAVAGSPRFIAPPDLPVFLVLVGSGQPDYETGGTSDMMLITRTFRLLLLVMPWAEGLQLEAEETARGYTETIYDTFLGRPALELTRGVDALRYVQQARITNDSGLVNITLGAVAYAGVEYQLEVTYARPIYFA